MFKKGLWTLFAAVVAAGLLFTGCPTDGGDLSELSGLEGSWVSSYGEEYTIENGEFISAYGGSTSYKGPIVHVRKDDISGDAGYLTIKYTENMYSSAAIGNYYVIRWEDLTNNTEINISGAYNSEAPNADGYDTLAAAEAGYTGTIGTGSFAMGTSCIYAASQPSDIEGSWTDDEDPSNKYTITDKLVIYSVGSTTKFIGKIVNVRTSDDDDDHNYITFKYISNTVSGGAAEGEYCVLYWTELNDTADSKTVKLSVANNSTPGDSGKTTQSGAKKEYIMDDANDYYEDIAEFAEPPS